MKRGRDEIEANNDVSIKRRPLGDTAELSPYKFKSGDDGSLVQDHLQSCMEYLCSLCPSDGFLCEPPLPAIILQHQLYSLLQDRTAVDRKLMLLRDSGKIRQFKLGVMGLDLAVVQDADYISYLKTYFKVKGSQHKWLLVNKLLSSVKDVSITETQLKNQLKLTQGQISDLVRCGVLVVRDVGVSEGRSWWLAIPALSPYSQHLTAGRRLLKQWLQRAKSNELLQSEVEARKWTVSKLDVLYHIHDIIGADVVEWLVKDHKQS